MAFYLNSGTDYTIQDGTGRVYTVDEARRAWEQCPTADGNVAFQRLVDCDFDLERVKAFYQEANRIFRLRRLSR